jgi:PAS domain S-box-containing protein
MRRPPREGAKPPDAAAGACGERIAAGNDGTMVLAAIMELAYSGRSMDALSDIPEEREGAAAAGRPVRGARPAGWRSALAAAVGRLRLTRRAILLSGLLMALMSDAFVAWMLRTNYDEAYRAADTASADLVRALEEFTLRHMEAVDLLLRSISDDLANPTTALMVRGNPQLIDLLRRRGAPYRAVLGTVVIDAAGNLVADSAGNGVPGREFNFSDRDYFRAQRDNPDRGLFIDAPVAARVDPSRRFIAVSRALKGPDGAFAGVVLAAVNYDLMRDFFRSLDVGGHGGVTLFRDDGLVLAREPTGGETVGQNLSWLSLLQHELAKGPAGSFDGPGSIDSTPRRISYRRVRGMPLVVSVARSHLEFLAGWKNNAVYYSAAAAILNVMMIGFGMLLARQWRLREESQKALQESLEHHRLVTENLPALVVHVGADMRIRYANRVGLQWFRRTAESTIGRKVSEILSTDGFARQRPKIDAVLAGRPMRTEEHGLFPDGVERWCDTVRVPDRAEDGTIRGWFTLGIDISERKRFEEQLRQSQKIEAIGQLAGGIAHDSNNMLAATLGNLDLLLDGLPRGEAQCRAFAERAIEAAERVADLNRRLLAFARKQSLHPQMTDVNQLVGGMTAILRRTLGETIEIELRQDDRVPSCLIDPVQLQNALLNLAVNGRDAMPGGGRLTIETARELLAEVPAGSDDDVPPGEYVVIAVTDTGSGMAPEVARRAFEPFFTTKEIGQGSGLGLSMVYGFARQSGGTVRLASKVEAGTTVKLYLPAAGGAVAEPEARPGPPLRAGRGETILVVEDNPLVSGAAANMLSSLGYRPVVVADGPAAQAAMAARGDIALLLTDVVLPKGMTGFDLARAARLQRPQLPVLFISGLADTSPVPPELTARSILLAKPFRVAQLAEALAGLLGGEAVDQGPAPRSPAGAA